MALEFLSALSRPGNPEKPNDDAFAHSDVLAAVFDGATNLGDPVLPADSDAAWIARKGAEGLIAHQAAGAREALRLAAVDAECDFKAMRVRVPQETWEHPFASMMLVAPRDGALDCLWFGDCAALVKRPGEAVEVIGESFAKRSAEATRAAQLAQARGIAPASASSRPEFLAALRAGRNTVNSRPDRWLFSADARCAAFVATKTVAAPAGTIVLLASDGFLALATDYNAYTADTLVAAAQSRGLKPLYDELRAIEADDADGRRFARFKKSDDATAMLVKIV
jgi:serine/threonine protein phosphatase PrpC